MRLPERVKEWLHWMDDASIQWALGASSVLYFNGHPKIPNDLDCFVAMEDFEKVADRLRSLGRELTKDDAGGVYNTQGFGAFEVDGLEIDLIAGFYVRHPEGEYRTPFDAASIDQRVLFQGAELNLMALEDWFILYQLIPGRNAKAIIAGELIRRKPLIRWDLLKRALPLQLPGSVRESIEEMLRLKA